LSDWQQKVQTLSGQLTRQLFIASGGDGTVKVLDATNLNIWNVQLA
jgi:hypothetical protein